MILYDVVLVGETIVAPNVSVALKPVPTHFVAFVLVQESVDELPDLILFGLAVKVSVGLTGVVGGGVAVTVTVAVSLTEPPEPVQVIL